jgi:[protein-PII] uridylyltransferase
VTPSEQLAARADQVDRLVLNAFERSRPSATLVAVGGYGRRELFPSSDVDLLLLVDEPPEGDARNAIAEFLRILWDDKLRIGQSVRTVRECCEIHEGNLELTISLLDQRFLGGERTLFEQLEAQFPKFLNAQRPVVAKHLCAMTRGRHAKYGNTIYHLEPNVKEHPGGLRDVHVVHWLGRLKGSEAEALASERDFLFGVRIFLHQHFQRDNNLLTFDAQEELAQEPAAWMRAYYRNAREIFRAVTRTMEASENAGSKLLAQFRDWRSRVSTEDFTVAREQVLLRRPQQIYADAALVMRLIQFVSRHQLRLAWDTEQRIRKAVSEGAPLAASWDDWREVLRHPRASMGLRALQETGALARLIPEWQRIDCLVTRDFYHRYTVDEHTLVTIQSIEDLAATSDPLRRRFADLLTEIDRPEVLRLALLLHDIGKGAGTGEHAAESVRIASAALKRLGVPDEAAGAALFLIEHHLDLSSLISSRDLGDPATARLIAEFSGTIERLKFLTLLTYADISAVNPTAMTPWRLEQLWRAYLAGYEELTKELDTDRIHGPRLDGELARFVEGFPVRYLRTHSEAEVRGHAALAAETDSGGTRTNLERLDGSYRLTLVTQDRPALLASVSGALAGLGMNILKAEAFSNAHGLCLDTFTFSDPHRTLELNPTESDRLCDTVRRAVQGKIDVDELLQNRRRSPAMNRGRQTQPAVAFNNSVSETATLIEIVAEDRPGLLHHLARTISAAGCNIEVVLIDTEAHRALDVFYVTRAGGRLPEDLEPSLKCALLAVCRG